MACILRSRILQSQVFVFPFERVMKETLKRLPYILLILAIAFVFTVQWGPGSRGCNGKLLDNSQRTAAMVNDQEIPLVEFNRAYTSQLQYFRSQGNPLSDSLARQVGIPKQILNQLVESELLAQVAEKRGVGPSDDEVKDLILKDPSFQKEGSFDAQLYQDTVRDYLKKTVQEYEADLRRRLAANKLSDLVESEAFVSEDEIKAAFFKTGNKASATFVRFLPAMFASQINPADPEVTHFQEAHLKEVAGYYQANLALYSEPEKAKASHVLLKVAAGASSDQKAGIRKKLEGIRKEIVQGRNFGEAAKQYSEDAGSKDKAGDLGWNARQNWAPTFASAAFALKPGEMSQPIETQLGYHLIQLAETKPAEKKELASVQHEIARILLKKELAQKAALQRAEEALALLKHGEKLQQAFPAIHTKDSEPSMRFETETKPEATETGSFAVGGESVPQLGPAPQLVTDILQLSSPGVLGKVYAVGEGFAVVEVSERQRSTEDGFKTQRDALEQEALKSKQAELRQSFLKALKKTAKITLNPSLSSEAPNAT